jgi:hypothetical protein
MEGKTRNVRNLKIREFFRDRPGANKPRDSLSNKFTMTSTWLPPTSSLSTEVKNLTSNIANDIQQVVKKQWAFRHPKDGLILHSVIGPQNLTQAEQQAIQKLAQNKDLVIKPADKGSSIVLLDRKNYIMEGKRQLSDKKYYLPLEQSVAEDTCVQINQVLYDMHRCGFITDKQLKYLKAERSHTPRSFYMLPKIHKPRGKWPHPEMPAGRPIVSNCGSPTEKICKFIDYFLKPLATKHEAYIKDSYDFVDKIGGLRVPTDCLLVTADVEGLYTNMNMDRCVEIIREAFALYPDPKRPDEHLICLFEICLRNNDFEFDGQLFLQILGCAMGLSWAPSAADLYLKKLDGDAKRGFAYRPRYYFRFLDDCFWVWYHGREELKKFADFLNQSIPGIKITMQVADHLIQFLDLAIYKKYLDNGECELRTRVYFKTTDKHQLLHAKSFHPRHTSQGIIKSQLIRYKRLCSTQDEYKDACNILWSVLKLRGYSRTLYRTTKHEVWRNTGALQRGKKSTNTDEIWPVVGYYDKTSSYLTNRYVTRLKQLKVAQKRRIVAAYKVHKNLRKRLVRSRLRPNQGPLALVGVSRPDTAEPINTATNDNLSV